jgi:hypothetical protein
MSAVPGAGFRDGWVARCRRRPGLGTSASPRSNAGVSFGVRPAGAPAEHRRIRQTSRPPSSGSNVRPSGGASRSDPSSNRSRPRRRSGVISGPDRGPRSARRWRAGAQAPVDDLVLTHTAAPFAPNERSAQIRHFGAGEKTPPRRSSAAGTARNGHRRGGGRLELGAPAATAGRQAATACGDKRRAREEQSAHSGVRR